MTHAHNRRDAQRTQRTQLPARREASETGVEMSSVRQLLRVDGREYGTAADIAARLTTTERPIDASRIRDWARRSRNPDDPLHGLLPGIHMRGQRRGTTWYDLQHAAKVALLTKR